MGKHEPQLCCMPCFENDSASACYILDIHQLILIIFLQTVNLYYEVQCVNIISCLDILCITPVMIKFGMMMYIYSSEATGC